jgi:hypothetical protein
MDTEGDLVKRNCHLKITFLRVNGHVFILVLVLVLGTIKYVFILFSRNELRDVFINPGEGVTLVLPVKDTKSVQTGCVVLGTCGLTNRVHWWLLCLPCGQVNYKI